MHWPRFLLEETYDEREYFCPYRCDPGAVCLDVKCPSQQQQDRYRTKWKNRDTQCDVQRRPDQCDDDRAERKLPPSPIAIGMFVPRGLRWWPTPMQATTRTRTKTRRDHEEGYAFTAFIVLGLSVPCVRHAVVLQISEQATGARAIPSPESMMARLDGKLSLSDDQKIKLLPILRDRQAKIKAVLADSSGRRMQQMRKTEGIMKESDKQIKTILTADSGRPTPRWRIRCVTRCRNGCSGAARISGYPCCALHLGPLAEQVVIHAGERQG